MASTIKYQPFKRGDTPVFVFNFSQPFDGFSWSGVTADCAITAVTNPTDNTGAAVYRSAQTLTVNDDNSATFSVQPTVVESKALIPGKTYQVEVQLKDGGGANVATALTGTVLIKQDYVI